MTAVEGVPLCRSCGPDFGGIPAAYIANAYGDRREDDKTLDWPVCNLHLPYAMCAGWFPLRKIGGDA